jgi:hypothetical protein
VFGGLGVRPATLFSMMGHARLSNPAQYNIRADTSIAGSNNGTIGIERRGQASPSGQMASRRRRWLAKTVIHNHFLGAEMRQVHAVF